MVTAFAPSTLLSTRSHFTTPLAVTPRSTQILRLRVPRETQLLRAVLDKRMTHTDIKRYRPGPHFSQMVVHSGLVYLAGQVAKGAPGDVYRQTEQTLHKIDRLLEEAGTDKTRVVSATVWMVDVQRFAEMNRAWDAWMDRDNMPVRATVQSKLVSDELEVEIQVTAALPSPARTIETKEAAEAVGPYNQGIVVDDGTIYVSGCIGLLPGNGGMVEGGVETQTKQALSNIRAVLAKVGAQPTDIVKTTILLNDMADFTTVNAIYKEFFEEGRVPARSCFAAKQLPKGALVEIEAIASLPQI